MGDDPDAKAGAAFIARRDPANATRASVPKRGARREPPPPRASDPLDPSPTISPPSWIVSRVREDGDMNQYWYSAASIGALVRACAAAAGGTDPADAAADADPPTASTSDVGGRIAFLSSPSVYFALPRHCALRARSAVLDPDPQFRSAPAPPRRAPPPAGPAGSVLGLPATPATHPPTDHWCAFDFRDPEGTIPDDARWRGAFDLVVVDPPFVTEDVWTQYAAAARLLLRRDPRDAPAGDDGGGAGGAGGAAPGGADDPWAGRRVLCTTLRENLPLLRRLFGGALRRQRWRPSVPRLPYQYDCYANWPGAAAALGGRNPELPESSDDEGR